MPSDPIVCFCHNCCTRTNPDGRKMHRKTVLKHLSEAKRFLASLDGKDVSPILIENVSRGIEATSLSIMGLSPDHDQSENISATESESIGPTFWEIQVESNNLMDSEMPTSSQDKYSDVPMMDLGFEHLESFGSDSDNSDSQSIISAERETLLWDSEESDSDFESDKPADLDNSQMDMDDMNYNHGDITLHSSPSCSKNILPQAPSPNSSNDDLDSDEEDSNFTTPALQKLKKELLGDYRVPAGPPSEPFIRPILNDMEKLSLKHYAAWQKSNGTVQAYNYHASVLSEATGTEILSLYKVESLAESITRLYPRKIDMCPRSCIAYTGKYSQLEKCEYVSSATKEPCNTSRYNSRRQPAAQYAVLPVKATIDALYANAETAYLMRHRDNQKKAVLDLLGKASTNGLGNPNRDQRTYSDFGDSYVHTEIHDRLGTHGLFKDPRNVAFGLSTDGAQLTMKKQSNTWILILTILNLPPEVRYKSEYVIISFATPGPNSPGDIESFMRPLFEEMAQGSEGLWIWDALDSAYFLIKHAIAIGAGDMLGSAKINGMAGHAAIYGDRFSRVQAAKSSAARGSKAQYYPILTSSDKYNPNRPQYSYNMLPIRQHLAYFKTLRALEAANNENQRRNITKATGVSRLPLCAASPAFFHPTFFPLDPFHLIYENCMAFIWDLWTIDSAEGEIMHLSSEKAANVGKLVAEAMETLPPSFCGPIRDPYLKRQSQYKVFEWMALLHWYLVPICLELNFNSLILENFSHFVRAMDYAMTNKARSEHDLSRLHSLIAQFLTDFERLYIGDNPDLNHRARLCIFQLIHIPIHIKWNGSIRIGSQATVERAIGEMGHKIRSKKSPFVNLTNLIIRRERIKLLCLYYPELSLSSESNPAVQHSAASSPGPHLFQKIHIRISDCQPGADVSIQIAGILSLLRRSNVPNWQNLNFDDFERYGKLRLLNDRVLHTELAYTSPRKVPTRKSYWFWGRVVESENIPLFGLALAFYQVKLTDIEYRTFVAFRKLVDVEEVLGFFRGRQWSTETHIIEVERISDLIGIWSYGSWIYILQKHPGLDMLNNEESGREIE